MGWKAITSRGSYGLAVQGEDLAFQDEMLESQLVHARPASTYGSTRRENKEQHAGARGRGRIQTPPGGCQRLRNSARRTHKGRPWRLQILNLKTPPIPPLSPLQTTPWQASPSPSKRRPFTARRKAPTGLKPPRTMTLHVALFMSTAALRCCSSLNHLW